MTPAAAIPTVLLSDDNAIPVLGIGVADLPPAEVEEAVSAALAAGYRLIDAVSTDGTEEAVGRAIAKSGVAREELFVTTKLATADQGFQASQDACKASLARLGLDYVDLYLIHWPAEQNGKYVDAWGGLMKVREIGEARSIGVSNFNPEQLSDVIDLSFVTPVINQVELHPLLNQSELRAFHAQHGIVTEAYCPTGEGTLLTNPAIAEVAAAHGKTAAQVLIRWSIQSNNVVLTGSSDPAAIGESLDIFDFELTDADLTVINGLENGTRFRPNPAVYAGD
jgi:diketogulonate reductase-like aldo/keto reductase